MSAQTAPVNSGSADTGSTTVCAMQQPCGKVAGWTRLCRPGERHKGMRDLLLLLLAALHAADGSSTQTLNLLPKSVRFLYL